MKDPVLHPWIIEKNPDGLDQWINAFLVDRKAQNLSKTTPDFYQKKLQLLKRFAQQEHIRTIAELTPDALRRYLLWLEETDHNPGGVNACYRVLKAFLLWYEDENEPEGWKNPIHKIKAPKLSKESLAPVELSTAPAMLEACPDDLLGLRDKALLLLLLDTGARASEVCSMVKGEDRAYTFCGGLPARGRTRIGQMTRWPGRLSLHSHAMRLCYGV